MPCSNGYSFHTNFGGMPQQLFAMVVIQGRKGWDSKGRSVHQGAYPLDLCKTYGFVSDTLTLSLASAAAFHSQHTHITPSTYMYVYTSFDSDFLLVTSISVGKMSRQTLLIDCLLYWPHIAWAHCHHHETESTLRSNRAHRFWFVTQ